MWDGKGLGEVEAIKIWLRLGEVEMIKIWLRKVREAEEFLDFDFRISDINILQTCSGTKDKFQLYECVEHIAHVLQIPIVYSPQKNLEGKTYIEARIEFEGKTYFEIIR